MDVEVHIVNAFIDGGVGGNPAGVVLNAGGLTYSDKLNIAQQLGLSETAFLSPSDVASIKLEFFTPTRQIAHCGHATVATFYLLRQLGILLDGRHTKETIDGIRDVLVDGEIVSMVQQAPRYKAIAIGSRTGQHITASLGLDPTESPILADPYVVDTANAFLLVQVNNKQTLATLCPSLPLVEGISDKLDVIGFYAFALEDKKSDRHASARMFAPRFGIAEESATGTAAGPLGCYLHDYLKVSDLQLRIQQGHLMKPPSPSLIQVNLNLLNNQITTLTVGGTARINNTTQLKIVDQ
ncbi:PhzF family phenazine biosynthesis protein [Pseudohongiella spirulinae]|uniref:Phenazine biosynthesis PhzC/PhzF protein n=1 Tax=Pseudohongiella spirulinae TaxID=1249552 RepID=A0A0S2K8X9_9GAMM|nr:PhzF family phenazine biosynthesis protein [Pseudohongiella spirulinae]ALO44791.1 Phenazine biosynthesis PhzC/PhzF protein [Pseudohongiella spirulinae]